MSDQTIGTYKWRISQMLINRRALFILWAIKTLFCTTRDDFLGHYKISETELTTLLKRLTIEGFLQEDSENYVLTQMGEETVRHLGELDISEFAEPGRLSREVLTRFGSDEESVQSIGNIVSDEEELAKEFWKHREHDRGKPEATLVELPFIQQLTGLGWLYQAGHIGAPEFTGRRSFHEVVIEKYLREALPEVNRDPKSNAAWLGESQLQQMVAEIKRLLNNKAPSLLQANREATERLQKGMIVSGSPELHRGRTQRVHFIDFVHPERNRFLVISQFRVDLAGARYIVPDLVLFVNGIPLAVVECKNPALTNPVEEGITQLLRYTNQSANAEEAAQSEAVPELFYFNQLLISTCYFQARFAPLGASYEHFQEWKDPYLPKEYKELRDRLPARASSQQTLILGMLFPHNLLDLLYNFTIFDAPAGVSIKQVIYYHQFRAVQKVIQRLQDKQTRQQHGEEDQRGGIIWHTQGSGKSLTMVFLVRKMRTISKLQNFKIIFVTDRKQLEQQLRRTALQTDEKPRTARAISELEPLLRPEGSRLIFAMIQKYQLTQQTRGTVPFDEDKDTDEEAAETDDEADEGIKANINPEENILVIVDEAHRSQTRKLHANLRKMLPNCARMAFTGTPIIRGPQKKTFEIFGGYIDQYTIRQSELDGATLPILYEGREVYIQVTQRQLLDEKHDSLVNKLPYMLRESLYEGYATYREILEGEQAIEKKAEDMLLHYAEHILPDGFKAMLVAVSRLAAIRYRDALNKARQNIVARLDELPLDQRNLREDQIQRLNLSDEEQTLRRIFPARDLLNRLQFAAVVSASASDLKDTRVDWSKWNSEEQNEHDIAEFKKPLPAWNNDAQQSSPLAFLCVRSMLITGFDAPVIQALYLDRSMKNHELLQAIARVNRLAHAKGNGLVIDYYGIAQNLKDALSAYSETDIQGALTSIKDEYPLLADRHRRVLAIFESNKCDIQELESCIHLLRDPKIRSDFEIKFKKFMQSLETVLPRPQALNYIADAQQLGIINQAASATYRDDQLNLINIGNKVRKLIDEHIDVLQIRQIVAPISIHDVNFAQRLRHHQSDETNAAEMEGFAREYITYHFAQKDPAYYNKLSERLETIVNSLQGQWSESVTALGAFIADITKPREINEKLKLDPGTELPFFGILEEEVRKGSRRFAIPVNTDGSGRELTEDEQLQLAEFTKDMIQNIRQRFANNDDFWLFADSHEDLRKEIGGWLERKGKKLLDPYQRREAVSSRLVTLALRLTTRLRNA